MLKNVSAESVEDFVEENINTKSVVFTDKNMAYINLESLVEDHIKVKSSEESTKKDLNWVHTAISNLKKTIGNLPYGN